MIEIPQMPEGLAARMQAHADALVVDVGRLEKMKGIITAAAERLNKGDLRGFFDGTTEILRDGNPELAAEFAAWLDSITIPTVSHDELAELVSKSKSVPVDENIALTALGSFVRSRTKERLRREMAKYGSLVALLQRLQWAAQNDPWAAAGCDLLLRWAQADVAHADEVLAGMLNPGDPA